MIRITNFSGEIPKRHPRLLPAGYSQSTRNCRLENGALVPYRESAAANTFGSTVQTIYRHDGTWLGWNNASVRAAPGPVATDRLYVTGDGKPKLIAGGTTYDLELPAPTTRPTLVVNGTVDADTVESISYGYTWVTDFDEESALGPLATVVDWSPGLSVTISGYDTVPPSRNVTKMRFYRSQTSALGVTELYYVAEQDLPLTTYDHDLTLEPTQELETVSHFSTPVDTLEGITVMPNGIMAAFDGKELYFCEPYKPHTWPTSYSLITDYDIVALVAFGSTLAVLTEGTPYIVQGTHPDNMQMAQVEENLPCLAARSAVDLGYAAVYASTGGLVSISSNGAQVITRDLFTLEQWEDLVPSSFVAERYHGRYIVSHTPGGAGRELGIVDLTGSSPFYNKADGAPTSMFHEIETGNLFMLTTATAVVQFDADGEDRLTQSWKSQVFNHVSPTNYGAILIEGEVIESPETISVQIYADGVLKHTETTYGNPARLPGGFMAREWEIVVTGNLQVASVSIAESIAQLRNAL